MSEHEVIALGQEISVQNKGRIHVVIKQPNHSHHGVMAQELEHRSLPQLEQSKHDALRQVEKELDQLVGLQSVKKLLKEIYAWLYINQKRKEEGLKAEKQALHMIFKGNPGTGKTTVARLIAKFFYQMNVLSKGHLVEVERADLVGEYIGHTAQKTREVIKKSLGGVLFIDEAYSLARGGRKDFGKEAIDTLVKQIDDLRHDFVLILAGYSKEMDYFLSMNPGLPSRFPLTLDFEDYSTAELMEIGMMMVKEREYRISAEGERKIREQLKRSKMESGGSFSNGRFVRNLIEKAIRAQAVRLLVEGKYDRQSLTTLNANDFDFSTS